MNDSWSATNAATATWPERATMNSLVADGMGQAWLSITRITGGVLSGSVLRNRRASLVDDFAWTTPLASPRDLSLGLAANRGGQLLAICAELKSSNTMLALTGASAEAGSQTWSAESPLETFAFDPNSDFPAQALDGYGHGSTVWVTSDGAHAAVAASRIVHGATVTFSSPADISARTVNTLTDAKIALEADGRGVASWIEDDGNQVTLWASAFR